MIQGLQRRDLIGLVLLTLCWGLNWPLMKFSLRELTPLYFRALTMTGGALILAGWTLARGGSLAMPAGQWSRVIALALPNMLGWHLCSIMGVQALASGRAAILGFTMPTWTALFGIVIFGERLAPRTVIALLCSLTAVTLLIWHEVDVLARQPVGVLWMLVAAVAWAFGTIMMRRWPSTLATDALTAWMMGLSCIPLWIAAITLEPAPTWQFTAPMWASIAWGFAINYGVCQILWFSLARSVPPTTVALSIIAVPIIGLFSAMAVVGETPSITDLFAAGFIVTGLIAVLLRR